jgi:hypothetical protein
MGSPPNLLYTGTTVPPPQGIYEESETPKAALGARWWVDDRRFVYCRAGGTALVAGKLGTAAVLVANHINIACVAGSGEVGIKGKRAVQVTLGATAATSNQYARGYLHFTDNGEEGRTHGILRHPAADASATLTLTLHDALLADVAATHEVYLEASPFAAVIVGTGAITDFPVGIPQLDVTASYYYWAQYWGPCAVLAEANPPVLGTTCSASGTTAGALEVREAVEEPAVGVARVLGVSTEYTPVFLTIPI